jgi:hypothetical protein
MMKFIACMVVASVVILNESVEAKEQYVARLPNGANVPGAKAVGHVNPEGNGRTNKFGAAFDDAGKKWTKDLCEADSDGDGQSNGEELGDPCCEWTQGSTPRWSDGVSHPGDSSKTSNESLWKNIDCTTTKTIAAASSLKMATSAVVVTVGAAVILATRA